MIQYQSDFSSFFNIYWRKFRFFCSGIMPLRYAEVTCDMPFIIENGEKRMDS